MAQVMISPITTDNDGFIFEVVRCIEEIVPDIALECIGGMNKYACVKI